MATASRTWITPEQYLDLERKAQTKSEYYRGEVFAMSGASREHNLIALNLGSEIRNQLKGRPCEAYVADMRVVVDRTGLYTYPDVVVVCGSPRFLDREVDTLVNPTVLVEILSESTEKYDRGRRSFHFRQIESLREYVLVAQDRMAVECYSRRGEEWVLTDSYRPDDLLRLESVGVAVPLRELYARIEFPAAGASTEGLLAGPPAEGERRPS